MTTSYLATATTEILKKKNTNFFFFALKMESHSRKGSHREWPNNTHAIEITY